MTLTSCDLSRANELRNAIDTKRAPQPTQHDPVTHRPSEIPPPYSDQSLLLMWMANLCGGAGAGNGAASEIDPDDDMYNNTDANQRAGDKRSSGRLQFPSWVSVCEGTLWVATAGAVTITCVPQWRALALSLAAQALRIIHPRLSSQPPQRELPTFRRRASVDRCGGGGDSVHYPASAPDRAGPSIIIEAAHLPPHLSSHHLRARPSTVVSEPKPLQDHF